MVYRSLKNTPRFVLRGGREEPLGETNYRQAIAWPKNTDGPWLSFQIPGHRSPAVMTPADPGLAQVVAGASPSWHRPYLSAVTKCLVGLRRDLAQGSPTGLLGSMRIRSRRPEAHRAASCSIRS
jgi:hypothetical protein